MSNVVNISKAKIQKYCEFYSLDSIFPICHTENCKQSSSACASQGARLLLQWFLYVKCHVSKRNFHALSEQFRAEPFLNPVSKVFNSQAGLKSGCILEIN